MLKKPYKGNENYIFISYSHKNTKEVQSFIEQLQRNGYNVWYDEGIDPGTEWDDNIASHIEKCSSFIAYVTNDYIASQNCRDEMSFARDLDKERLLIYAEEVELPKGMQMRLNRWQAIYKHKYNKQDDFYNKVFESNTIEKCKSDSQGKLSSPETLSQSKGGYKESLPDNNKMIPMIIVGAIACIAVIAIIMIFISPAKKDKDSVSESDSTVSSTSLPQDDVAEASTQTEPTTSAVSEPKEGEEISINKSNAHSILYMGEDITITLDGASYIQGASGANIYFTIENNSKELLWLAQDNKILIDGVTLSPEFEHGFNDGDAVEAKQRCWSTYSVTREDIVGSGVEDFKEMTTTFYIRLGEKDLATKILHISRDAFSEE